MGTPFLHVIECATANDQDGCVNTSHHGLSLSVAARGGDVLYGIQPADPTAQSLVKSSNVELEISFEATTHARLDLIMKQQGETVSLFLVFTEKPASLPNLPRRYYNQMQWKPFDSSAGS